VNNNQNKDFEALVKTYLDWKYAFNPSFASYLGLSSYDPCVRNFSSDATGEAINKLHKFKTLTEKVLPDRLNSENRIDRVLLLRDIELQLIRTESIPYWQLNPQVYLDEALDGIHVLMLKTFRSAEEIAPAILKKMKKIPEIFLQGKENLKNCPPVFLEVSAQTAGHGPGFIDIVLNNYAKISPSLERDFLRAGEKAKDALKDFRDFIKNITPGSENSFAAGRENFSRLVRAGYMIDKDIDEILSEGEDSFAEISIRLTDLAAELDPEKSWYEVFRGLKRENPGPAGILSMYMKYMNEAREYLIENDIVTIIENQCLEVEETPGFIRPLIPVAAYISPGPYDEVQRGVFWVTPVAEGASGEEIEKIIGEHNIYTAKVTAPHEAYPGHHLQLCSANLQKSPLRKQSNSDIFVEGWGLYCEEMLKEEGFLSGPELELAQQVDQLMRAARVIIDIRLHTSGMAIEEAKEFLRDVVLVSPVTADVEVNRYTMTPTQPLSYMAGQREILSLREDYKKNKGSAYRLKNFHDEILKCGSAPIKVIRHMLLGEEL